MPMPVLSARAGCEGARETEGAEEAGQGRAGEQVATEVDSVEDVAAHE